MARSDLTPKELHERSMKGLKKFVFSWFEWKEVNSIEKLKEIVGI